MFWKVNINIFCLFVCLIWVFLHCLHVGIKNVSGLTLSFFLTVHLKKIEFIRVISVNKTTWLSGAYFYNIRSVLCVCVHHPRSSVLSSPFTPLRPLYL